MSNSYTPPSGSGARSSGSHVFRHSLSSAPDADPKLWSEMMKAPLWKAIAISVNREPVERRGVAGYGYWDPRDAEDVFGPEFLRRLRIAENRLGGNAESVHDLAKVASLASSLGWSVPEWFPIGSSGVSTAGYATPWLGIMNSAIKEFFSPRRNPDAKKDEVVKWIKDRAISAGLDASEQIASAIFTIIKPVDHDPRKRR